MLDFMRRNARSWGIKIALGIICLVFVFFMGGGGQIGASRDTMATVGGAEISVPEFQRARVATRARYRDQYGDNLPPELERALNIPSRALSELIDAEVLGQEARRLGLRIPDETVRSAIRQVPAFQRDGVFSSAAYKAAIVRQGLSAAAFEESLRRDLLISQLVDVIRRGVHVTEAEVLADYRQANEKIVLSYVSFAAGDFRDQVEINDEALEELFESDPERYRKPETVRVAYLAYRTDDFKGQGTPSDERVEEYYILNQRNFSVPEKVSARHILKKVAADADDQTRAEALAAIEGLAARIEEGEDFAELARAHSEDGSASAGGDLGSFGRGRMVPSFEKAAFDLAINETSAVVESQFGYHLIQAYDRQEASTRSLEEAREEIIDKLASEAAADFAFDAAAADAAGLAQGYQADQAESLKDVATRRGLSLETTGLLSRGDIVPGLGSAPAFVDAAIYLEEVGDATDPVRIGEAYYLIELQERRDSYIPLLADIKDQLSQDYRKANATGLARDSADGLLDKLRAGRSLQEATEESGLEIKETGPFTRKGDFVLGLGSLPGLKELAFATTADGQALSRTFVHRGDAYVFVRSSREQARRKEFKEVREEETLRLRQRKEQEAFSELLKQLKQDIDISYNQELITALIP